MPPNYKSDKNYPTNELNIEPLEIHIKKLGLITYKRLENKLDKVSWCTNTSKSHLQYWEQDLHTVVNKMKDDRCDTTIYERFTNINTSSFDGKSIHIQKAETTIYTDGSKTTHGVGAGFIIYHRNKRICTESIHMPDTSTVFQAEIEAINHACQYVLANIQELNIKYVKILSDSQAAIQALNNPRITSQTVLTAFEHMETLALQTKNVTLAWIKAHVGTEGNKQADLAAKEGTVGGLHMKETKTPIPWQTAKAKIEEHTTTKWKQNWITSPHYKHTKLFYEAPNKNKSKYILKMGTHRLSAWIKGITGHNNLAYFKSKLDSEIDPTCRLCSQANETLYNLMTDCEATATIQMDIMRNQIPLPDMKWSVKDIKTFIQHPLIHSLMTYDTQYNSREIEYIDHNYSTDSSSL